MANSRKDSKGRKLKDGESERVDGRYAFRYTDIRTGKRCTIYAPDLPELREKEKVLAKDIEDNILTDGAIKKMTLNDLFERHMGTKEIVDTTRVNYTQTWKNRVKNEIGNFKVVQIRSSDIKAFYAKLSRAGYSHSLIKLTHNLIYPALEMAVEDDVIRKNPAKHALSEDYGTAPKEKSALTLGQQEKMLEFVSESNVYNVYYYMIIILLDNMERCGEFLGLTWKQVDIKKREITLDHQLIYKNLGEGYKLYVTEPKTSAGVRVLPMTETTYKAFAEQKKLNFMLGKHCTVTIEGYTDFIFLANTGRPMMPAGVNDILYNIVDAYNKAEVQNARKEHRNPALLPRFSSHILRHTGCTNKARQNMNVKVLQYLMGHAHSSVTMDVYNHLANEVDVVSDAFKNPIDSFFNRAVGSITP